MAKNQSPYTVHVETEDGTTVAVGPDEDLPAGAKVDNPYVTGKQKAEEVIDEPLPEAGDGKPDKEEPSSKESSSSSSSTRSTSKS
jgi:hypothetical protein